MTISILDKLAAAAAQASAPAQDPSQAGADPNAMGMAMPDPIEQDNMRLSNILQNLQLRQEVVQAQADLAQLTQQLSQAKQRTLRDPDAVPPSTSIIDDITATNSLETLLKKTPKISTNRPELKSKGSRTSRKQDSSATASPTVPGKAAPESITQAPI